MSKDKIYPKGIMTFGARDNAPEFVLGTMIVTIDDLKGFFEEQKQHISQYNGKDQLKFNMLKGDKGVYLVLDTYKAERAPVGDEQEDKLPF